MKYVNNEKLGSLSLWPIFFLLTALYIFFNGYDYLLAPDRLLVQKVMSLREPALWSNDKLVSLANSSFMTLLSWPLAFLNRWIELDWLFLISHFFCTLFYLHAVFILSKTVFRNELAAFVAVLAVFVIKPVLIDASLYPTYFYHRNVALVLQLYAINAFLQSNLLLTAILSGIAFNITPYSGLHLAFMVFVGLCFSWKKFSPRVIGIAIGIFFVIAAPVLLWRLMSPAGVSAFKTSPEMLKYFREYVAGYIFPTSFFVHPGSANAALMTLLWPVPFFLCLIRRYIVWEAPHRTIAYLSFAILILFIVGTVFTEWLPIPSVMQLMPFRSQKFLVLFGILYFSYYLIRLIQEKSAGVGFVWTICIVVAFLCSKMILTVLLTAVGFFLDRLGPKNKNALWFAIAALIIVAVVPAGHRSNLMNRLLPLDLYFVVLCGIAVVFFQRFVNMWPSGLPGRACQRIQLAVFSFVVMLIYFPNYWGLPSVFAKNPQKIITGHVQWPHQVDLSAEHQRFFDWVRRETSTDSVFLIPPQFDPTLSRYFRVKTKRGDLLTHEKSYGLASMDYAHYVTDLESAFQWLLRPMDELQNGVLSLEEIWRLRTDYEFDYFLAPRFFQPLPLPVIFQSKDFCVYRITEPLNPTESS